MKKEKSLLKEFAVQLVRSTIISVAALVGMEITERIWLNIKTKKKEAAKQKREQVSEEDVNVIRNCIIYPWENE